MVSINQFEYLLYISGVRTMHRAYVTSPGSQRNTLSNVKYGYKECTQTMCQIEAQLENMMGTFNCKLKGKHTVLDLITALCA